MLIFILIPLLVAAEWVEIAQNNYRTEPHNTMTPLFEESTNKNTIYRNHSFSNPQWSKGYVHRVPSTGNVKRIHGIERKPSVKIERNPFFRDDLITTEKTKRRFETNKPKSVIKVDENNAYRDNGSQDQKKRIRPASNMGFNRMSQNTSVRKLVSSDVMNTQRKHFRTTASQNINSERVSETDEINPKTTYLDSKDPLETLQKDFKKGNKEKFDEVKVETKKATTVSGTYEKDARNKNNENKNDNEQKQTKTQNIKVNEKKTSAIETLMKFLSIVTQTINQGTRRSFKSKVRYLENLKETLLGSIESRIDSAFPDDDTDDHHRQRRSARAESRGHVEVPSSESALMTISFLTFAVFLIKLVLQVIHTYKAKSMMVSPAVIATVGRGAAKFKKSTRN